MEHSKKTIGIIPARMGSSRFPGKPLKEIRGMPMLGHVYFRSKKSTVLDEVYIATPDDEIAEYAKSIGAQAVMTMDTHERASDRTAEAMLKIEKQEGHKVDIVVMIQGDEPMVHPDMIDMAVVPLMKNASIQVVNLMAPIQSLEEFNDPNCPKVVVDKKGFALYFSREPIPSTKKWSGGKVPMFKQVCIIPFTRDYLLAFNEMEPTVLEEVESIDMNRILEHGDSVKMVLEEFETHAVDTQQDLELVARMMEKDSLITEYVV